MKKFMTMAVILLNVFSFSCEKAEDVVSMQQAETITTTINENSKVSTSGTQTIYEVDLSIISNFQHYCQRNAGPANSTYPNATGNLSLSQATAACGPTSYMMSAHCLAKWANPNTTYSCSGSKLANIVSVTGTPTTLTALESYAVNYDGSFISKTNSYTSSRATSIQFIKDALTANRFVIVAVNAYTYDYNSVNNSNLYSTANNLDLMATGNTTTGSNRNYITDNDESSGVVGGHIIIIVRLVTNPDGSGIVEYIDPLAQTKPIGVSNRRYVSFTRLLNSMAINGNLNSQYDGISIGKK